MPKFFATFGSQYSDHSHPTLPEAHPDAFVVINADSANEAHKKLQERIGDKYAFIYNEDSFDQDLYPKGSIAAI